MLIAKNEGPACEDFGIGPKACVEQFSFKQSIFVTQLQLWIEL